MTNARTNVTYRNPAYRVSTVVRDEEGRPTVTAVAAFSDKIAAMNAAKKLAKGAKDCMIYGPDSLAYYGRDVTAVVAW